MDRNEEIRRMAFNGAKTKTIAKKFGLSEVWVNKIIRDNPVAHRRVMLKRKAFK